MTNEQNGVSRRSFLAGAAGLIGMSGLALASCSPQLGNNATGATVSSGLPETWNYETDVIVVGAGGGGLVASNRVADAGLEVILLEKMDQVGGDTFMSAQCAIGWWEGRTEEGDSIDLYIEDLKNGHSHTEKGMKGEPLPDEFPLTRTYFETCTAMYEYTQSLGIEWEVAPTVRKPYYAQPQSETKGSRLWAPANGGICSTLEQAAEQRGVEIMLSTPATTLITNESGRVVGVYALDEKDNVITLKARKGVILTCGGFNANRAMMSRYLPEQGMGFCGGSDGNTGDGHIMAHAIGAELKDMNLGSHWMTYDDVTNTTLYNNGNGRYGGPADLDDAKDFPFILVNYEGERYVAETDGYKWVGYHTNNQIGHKGFYIFDSGQACNEWIEGCTPYQSNSLLLHEYDTLEELAQALCIPADTLVATVDRYNSFVESGEDSDFGKSLRNVEKLTTPPFRAVCLAPRHYTTYGGIAIDTQSRVLRPDGSAIEGLYAAGTVTGAIVEQEGLYYQGGVSQTLVFGYIAGGEVVNLDDWE